MHDGDTEPISSKFGVNHHRSDSSKHHHCYNQSEIDKITSSRKLTCILESHGSILHYCTT